MQIIAVYPGRFHPFHRGHAASFKQLAQKFGLDNTYLAISAKQEQPKSPFSAQDRASMANSLGIPSKNIIAVRNPYAVQEYIDQLNLDPEQTAIVFGVSKKDMEGDPKLGIAPDPRFSFKAKKDGSPSYLQPFNSKKIDPLSQHGYVMSTDVAEFPIAGKTMRDASAIRQAYAGADQKTKIRILTDLYGGAAEKMKPIFDNNLQVTESIRALVTAIKPLLAEATLEQKAKFVKLLSEAKNKLSVHVLNENASRNYSKMQAAIIEDLGDGYFLGDDSYQDDDGFTKEGYSVYFKEGPNQYRMVGSVNMSPYKNPEGHVEREIQRLIVSDAEKRPTNENKKSRTMWVATDVNKDGQPEMSLAKIKGDQSRESDALIYHGDDPFVKDLVVTARKEAPSAKNDIEAVFHILARKTAEQDTMVKTLNKLMSDLEQHLASYPRHDTNGGTAKPVGAATGEQPTSTPKSPYVTESCDFIEEK